VCSIGFDRVCVFRCLFVCRRWFDGAVTVPRMCCCVAAVCVLLCGGCLCVFGSDFVFVFSVLLLSICRFLCWKILPFLCCNSVCPFRWTVQV